MIAGSDDEAAAVLAAGLITQTRSEVSVGFVFSSCVVALHTVTDRHVDCDVAAAFGDHVFAGQLVQLPDAAVDQKPARHDWHVSELEAPAVGEKSPAMQLLHRPMDGAAASADQDPIGHCWHSLGSVAATAEEYAPGVHARHEPMDVAENMVEYVPAAQLMQVVA